MLEKTIMEKMKDIAWDVIACVHLIVTSTFETVKGYFDEYKDVRSEMNVAWRIYYFSALLIASIIGIILGIAFMPIKVLYLLIKGV